MLAELKQGTLLLRLGSHFGVDEAARLRETVASFSPLSRLTLDFTAVREFQEAALGMLAGILGERHAGEVIVQGLPPQQARILNCVGE